MGNYIRVLRVSTALRKWYLGRVLLTCDSGEERWRSEGIQVGGIRSQRGVIGTWFDKDLAPHGPAGPTAFWKICDRTVGDDDMSDSEEEDHMGHWHV
jgi:hypothetical protein